MSKQITKKNYKNENVFKKSNIRTEYCSGKCCKSISNHLSMLVVISSKIGLRQLLGRDWCVPNQVNQSEPTDENTANSLRVSTPIHRLIGQIGSEVLLESSTKIKFYSPSCRIRGATTTTANGKQNTWKIKSDQTWSVKIVIDIVEIRTSWIVFAQIMQDCKVLQQFQQTAHFVALDLTFQARKLSLRIMLMEKKGPLAISKKGKWVRNC